MLSTLITSKTRIKLLLKFFLNYNTTGYLKNLEQEFEDSSNGIRLELNKFEQAGLLTAQIIGNKKVFKANTEHPLFGDIHNIILKYAGINQIIEKIVQRLGSVQSVYLVGSFAKGLESDTIDIVIIGKVNQGYLNDLIAKSEPIIGRKIVYKLCSDDSLISNKSEILSKDNLLIWNS